MLKEVTINNFKSHKNTNLILENLVVLCGANGVGKSSLIQVLLLLREAFVKDKSFKILDLKSNPAKIGTVADAVYQYGDYDGFQFLLNFSTGLSCNFLYEAFTENERVKSFINLNHEKTIYNDQFNLNDSELGKVFFNHSLFNTDFQYIGAGRLGPLEKYEKDDKIVDVQKQISVIEGKGEYFVHFLDKYRDIDVIDELCLVSSDNSMFKDLFAQVLLWEKYIFNGANAEIQDVGKLGYLLKYSFDSERSTTKRTNSFDAKNVGYGLSYTLPILVAILSAKKDSLILIENPEAHLHPNGISKLTELICMASQAGIQIVIETHSDHVINGIAVQCLAHEHDKSVGLDKANLSIYQFYRNEDENHTVAKAIPIEQGGRIGVAPQGFFDQIQIDLEKILGF